MELLEKDCHRFRCSVDRSGLWAADGPDWRDNRTLHLQLQSLDKNQGLLPKAFSDISSFHQRAIDIAMRDVTSLDSCPSLHLHPTITSYLGRSVELNLLDELRT